MVHLREGGGNFSSPHLVEYFKDQRTPKIKRRYYKSIIFHPYQCFQGEKSGGINSHGHLY